MSFDNRGGNPPQRFTEEEFQQFRKRQEQILKTFVEVKLKKVENFSVIRELLTRIGVTYTQQKVLRQSCFIFQKRGRYYIVHFKELFNLDGKLDNAVSAFDEGIRNGVVKLLEKQGLILILTEDNLDMNNVEEIHVLPKEEKHDWDLVPMYSFKSNPNNREKGPVRKNKGIPR